jgi:hypothetical protein
MSKPSNQFAPKLTTLNAGNVAQLVTTEPGEYTPPVGGGLGTDVTGPAHCAFNFVVLKIEMSITKETLNERSKQSIYWGIRLSSDDY